MEIQSGVFGFSCIISIEGSIYKYHNKYQSVVRNEETVKMDFHSYFSDDSAQNVAPTFDHMEMFIQ